MDTGNSKEPLGQIETLSNNEANTCKKAYVRPAFRFERVFETQALSCGKKSGEAHCISSNSTKNS